MSSDSDAVLPGSGDRAVASALERAKITAARNIPAFDDLPITADTANLRAGADLHPALLALLPLVGVWRGEGEGRDADGDYRFGQQIIVSHDGRDFLNWDSRSWRLNADGEFQAPDLRET
ncbi:MAG: FABP family protein, partial [Mycolicibacterium frederiksbergense]|nr:FABP family protein [Mycolicibacterium frederiksbergense]